MDLEAGPILQANGLTCWLRWALASSSPSSSEPCPVGLPVVGGQVLPQDDTREIAALHSRHYTTQQNAAIHYTTLHNKTLLYTALHYTRRFPPNCRTALQYTPNSRRQHNPITTAQRDQTNFSKLHLTTLAPLDHKSQLVAS